jgi:hypothetical protein
LVKRIAYSHSIVAGGLLLISYTTRLTPDTSLMIRVEILASVPPSAPTTESRRLAREEGRVKAPAARPSLV